MKKEILIDDYFDGYKSNILNCIDIPLAACAGHYDRNYYFYYCMIYTIYMNFLGAYIEPWVNARKGILGCLRINVYSNKLTEENIRKSLDNGSPSLIILKYGSLPYSRHYKTGRYDHGIIICGYDDEKDIYIIRDRELVRSYIEEGVFNSDVLFRMQVSGKELRKIINASSEINNGASDICNKIYSFSCLDNESIKMKDALKSLKGKIESAESSLKSYIEYRNRELVGGRLYDKEHIEADRRRYCNSLSMLVDAGKQYFEFSKTFLKKYELFYKNRLNLMDRIQMDLIKGGVVNTNELDGLIDSDKAAFVSLLREMCLLEEIK